MGFIVAVSILVAWVAAFLAGFIVRGGFTMQDVSQLVADVRAIRDTEASATAALLGIIARFEAVTNLDELATAIAEAKSEAGNLGNAVATVPPEDAPPV